MSNRSCWCLLLFQTLLSPTRMWISKFHHDYLLFSFLCFLCHHFPKLLPLTSCFLTGGGSSVTWDFSFSFSFFCPLFFFPKYTGKAWALSCKSHPLFCPVMGDWIRWGDTRHWFHCLYILCSLIVILLWQIQDLVFS